MPTRLIPVSIHIMSYAKPKTNYIACKNNLTPEVLFTNEINYILPKTYVFFLFLSSYLPTRPILLWKNAVLYAGQSSVSQIQVIQHPGSRELKFMETPANCKTSRREVHTFGIKWD
jgi:hypothetical protein